MPRSTIASVGCALAATALCAHGQPAPGKDPLATGQFHWSLSPPLFAPDQKPDDPGFSVKDPSIVFDGDEWHVFYTVRRPQRTHSIEYAHFADWESMAVAERHVLHCREGYFCAPQVFYFTPHRKWYLIYQVGEEGRTPGLQPAYSTTETLTDPDSWTPAKLFFDQDVPGVGNWIDFFVICDEDTAYLFFTTFTGRFWRMSTPIGSFPQGLSDLKLVLEGDIFEAAHVYRLGDREQYLAVIEAIGPEERRYFKAYVANDLAGDWRPLAAAWDQPFANFHNIADTGEEWTDYISHGELIRRGPGERLEVDPKNLQFLFQGVTSEQARGRKYGEIPWRLGLLTLTPAEG